MNLLRLGFKVRCEGNPSNKFISSNKFIFAIFLKLPSNSKLKIFSYFKNFYCWYAYTITFQLLWPWTKTYHVLLIHFSYKFFNYLYVGDGMNYSFSNMSYYNGKLVDGKTYMVFQRVHTTEVHCHTVLPANRIQMTNNIYYIYFYITI